jgi:hypothetical protein
MKSNRLRIATAMIAIAGAIATDLSAFAQAAPAQRPCRQLVAACQQAGFVRGGAKAGNGLLADCVGPIIKGAPQRPRATKSLPSIDAQLVAACKARDPRIGQRNGRPRPAAPPPDGAEPQPAPRAGL